MQGDDYMNLRSRKFLLTAFGTLFLSVLTALAFSYRPDLVIGLAGVMAGIITAYLTANVAQDYAFRNRNGKDD
ncbi:MAG: hypothetical protein DRH44_05960 [Candidatus Coatesbacteria bacterium]|nr:MAG: hypothetical protein DRH44_05960 [Candidatus Coatesbacteria bacterium]